MAKSFGRWRAVRSLASGGNAKVYVGVDESGEFAGEVAIKVLHVQKPNTEPYRRFRSEVAVHKRLTGRKGVLPLLDSNLPEFPNREDEAWLATPLATPIQQSLGDRPELRCVVIAVMQLAEALSMLAEEGISHRDIKPNNLYEYDGAYCLGDFGLVSYPGKEVITDGGRAVGPIYFQSPEMIFGPNTADGRRADVYSLGKSLWVLATGQRWPLPGEHRLDVSSMLLQQLVGGDRTELLDHLIARTTRIDHGSRPTMAEVVRELQAWLQPLPAERSLADVSQGAKMLEILMATGRQEQRDRQRYQEQFRAALEAGWRSLEPIRDRLREAGVAEIKLTPRNPSALESAPLDDAETSSKLADSDGISLLLGMPNDEDPTLWSGVGLQLFEDGKLRIVVSHRIRLPGHERAESLWHKVVLVEAGSADAQRQLAELIGDLDGYMPTSIARYVEAVREAQRAPLPLPKSGLSAHAQRLAACLSANSADAIADAHCDLSLLVERLSLAERDLVDAALELRGRGWVGLADDLNSRYGYHSVIIKPDLFLNTESQLHGANLEQDAIHFVRHDVESGADMLHVRERASTLGWNPRRTNVACYYLVAHSIVERAFEASTGPYYFDGFWLGSAGRDFLRHHC